MLNEMRESMLTTAIVTNNSDPDNLGRVKVQYPWNSDTEESDWARVSTLMAGYEQGLYFLPEIGQEVLVAFINGDTQSPIVIGSLWNQSDQPPETNDDGNNNIRKISSRSGHEIIFNDDEEGDSEKLELYSASRHKIVLDDTKVTIEDNAGGFIELDSANNKVSIVSKMDVSIEATNINIVADGELTLKGSLIQIN